MADWTSVPDKMQNDAYQEQEASIGANGEDVKQTFNQSSTEVTETTGTDSKIGKAIDAYADPPIEDIILGLATEIKKKRRNEEEEEYAREVALLTDSVVEILTEEASANYDWGLHNNLEFFIPDKDGVSKKMGYSEFYGIPNCEYDVDCWYATYPNGKRVLHFEKKFYGEIFSIKAQEYARDRLGLTIETDYKEMNTVIKRDFNI